MTFDGFCGTHRVTPSERTALVWHLASFRARGTVEALLPHNAETIADAESFRRIRGAVSELLAPAAPAAEIQRQMAASKEE